MLISRLLLARKARESAFPFQNGILRYKPRYRQLCCGILPKMMTAEQISALVNAELAHITDNVLLSRIRDLLVAPYPVERDWDYGRAGEKFTCWTVLEHRASNTGIAYCAHGFGPVDPWGLVFLYGEHMGIGMDSGWFSTLESAMRE
ncbi:MAG TPA: hypothetical protein VMU24_07485, partial [Candidatus Acidoferrales bacterium]|nr:hypothetical protein [Candidatus Acidoferrales bacterium]